MSSRSADLYYLRWARQMSEYSEDPSTKTGCIIDQTDGRWVEGWNRIPKGKQSWWYDRATKLKVVTHAEIAALTKADVAYTEGATAYIYPWLPCGQCLSALIGAGIKRIVAPKMDQQSERYIRWKKDFDLVREYAEFAGVELVEIEMEENEL